MKDADLNLILEKHSKYLRAQEGGERADLRGANLSCANLSYADLSCANLSYADLRGANLSDADLSYANLRDANLSYADLRGANLSCADLSDANLIYFTFNRDTAYFQFDGKIRIGCEYHSVDFWLENAATIGREQNYSELEIEVYQNFINMCVALQTESGSK